MEKLRKGIFEEMFRNFLISVPVVWLLVVLLIVQDDRSREAKAAQVKSQGDRVEVIFWHAMSGPLAIPMDDLIERFNSTQNKYYIKSVSMGSYDTLQKKILASLVANSAPDISQNYESLTKKFIKHGKIVAIDDLLASDAIGLSPGTRTDPKEVKADIIPVLLENNTFEGKLWSFPFNKSVPVLYYNKELFKKAGIDPDKPPTTLDELASYARRLTVRGPDGKTLVYGFASGKGNVWMFLCRTLAFGGRMIENSKSYFHEPPAVKAVQFMQDILKEGIAAEAQGFDHQNDFKAQRVAMIENSIVSKVHMESGIKFEYGIAPLPGAATHAVILSGSNINIFNNGDPQKIQGAWEFVKWFTSTDIGAEWSVRTTYVPVRKSSLQSPILKTALEKDPNLKAPYVQLDYTFFEPRISSWFEIRDLMADVLERTTLEMGSPSLYLNKLSEDIDGILSHTTE